MPNEILEELQEAKDVIVGRIKAPVTHTNVKRETNMYIAAVESFAYPDGFFDTPGNREKMRNIANDFQKFVELVRHKMDVLSLYKAAWNEHQKMMAASQVPDSVKQVSANNIRLYEQTMRENGITDDVMMFTVACPNEDYDQRLCEFFTNGFVHHMEDVAIQNGIRFVSNANRIERFCEDVLYSPEEDGLLFPNDLKHPEKKVYGRMAGSGLTYFDKVDWIYKKRPRNYAESPYQYYSVINGKCVANPYPKGVGAKIGYFFTKLFHLATVIKERRSASKLENQAQAELKATPKELADQPITADFHKLDPEGKPLAPQAIKETYADYLKDNLPKIDVLGGAENMETVEAPEKQNEKGKYEPDMAAAAEYAETTTRSVMDLEDEFTTDPKTGDPMLVTTKDGQQQVIDQLEDHGLEAVD